MKHYLLISSLFLVHFFSVLASQQVYDITALSISYGESLIDNVVLNAPEEDVFTWSIRDNSSSSVIDQGNGISLLDYVFNTPGSFTIEISHAHNHADHSMCVHSSFPEIINLTVSNDKITYLTEQLTISGQIRGGVSTNNLVVTLPVIIESYNGSSVSINPKMTSSGIDATIEGALTLTNTNLTPGRHELKYKLSGKALTGTYITFHFTDNNGKITSYYHLNKIN